MAYPEENTPEFWDLVASGYRMLLATPPKFIVPGYDREKHCNDRIKEAEAQAAKLRLEAQVSFTATPAFEESLQRKEAEMEALGAAVHEGRGYGLKVLELHHQGYSYDPTPEREPVRVTEDVWREVFKLD